MKNNLNQFCFKKKIERIVAVVFFILSIVLLQIKLVNAQTYGWTTYTAGSLTYTTGIMGSTITTSNLKAWGNGYSSPQYHSNTNLASGTDGIAGGLGLELFFGNTTTAYIQQVINFTSGATTNGTCASVSFQIKDINMFYGTGFGDIIDISAEDGTGTGILPACTVNTAGSVTSSNPSGSIRRLVGVEGYNGNLVTITVTPGAGKTLKLITLKYYPTAVGGCNSATAYWNFNSGCTANGSCGSCLRPAMQWVSIGPITATATGGGCVVGLPIELIEFKGKCNSGAKTFIWKTASETNNAFYTLEHSVDAEKWLAAKTIKGAGTTSSGRSYSLSLEEDNVDYKYYRLKQTDLDGKFEYFETLIVDCNDGMNRSFKIFPNPSEGVFDLEVLWDETDGDFNVVIYTLFGDKIMEQKISNENTKMDFSSFKNGMYQIAIFKNGNLMSRQKIVKQ